MRPTPVYIHSSWRTSSTYLWAKFRGRPDTCCYFEPLNEHLATATPAFIDAFEPWSYANHPKLDAPYLDEFRPLLGSDGLVGFPTRLSYEQYRADRHADLVGLKAYFVELDHHARSLGKTAVFGCVRTDLRLDWFRHHLDGVHIVLRRDPRRQFISFLNQAVNGNRYFLERGWIILGANRDDTAFAPLRRIIDVPAFDGPAPDRDDFYARLAWTTEWTTLYMISYFLHGLAARALETTNVDLVIDIDHLSRDPAAAVETEHKIEALTGAVLSLADCRVERYDKHLGWSAPFFATVEAQVIALRDVRSYVRSP